MNITIKFVALFGLGLFGWNQSFAQSNPYATGITVEPNLHTSGQPIAIKVSIGNNDDASSPIPAEAAEWTIVVPSSLILNVTEGFAFSGTPFYIYQITNGTNKTIIIRNNAALPASTTQNHTSRKFHLIIPATTTAEVASNVPNLSLRVDLIEGNTAIGNNTTGDDQATGTLQVLTPLSSNLLRFEGRQVGCDALLSWTSEKEESFLKYELQYSSDAKSFTSIATISNGKHFYEYRYAQDSAVAYYRLKLKSDSESFTFSDIIRVGVDCTPTSISLYPNPANDKLIVEGVMNGATIVVTNSIGRIVSSYIANVGSNELDIKSYTAGQYFVTISGQGLAPITLKFVKQ